MRILGALLLLGLLASCGEARRAARASSSTEASSREAPSDSTLWRDLGTWSGDGDRQTESFEVTSGALRLVWESRDGRGADATRATRLSVSLHSAISGRPLRTLVDTAGTGAGTVRFGSEPRVAYLLIEGEGARWRLTLQEGVAATSGPPPRRD